MARELIVKAPAGSFTNSSPSPTNLSLSFFSSYTASEFCPTRQLTENDLLAEHDLHEVLKYYHTCKV